MRRARQHELHFPEPRTHGGRREGAGRKKREDGVAHAPRERVSKHDPRHVTMRCVRGLPNLRARLPGRLVVACIERAQRTCFRITHFSIQGNHLHLLVEADDAKALGDGMRRLNSTVARRLNELWNRTGKVFAARYHDVVLKSLKQVRNALRYLLNNDLRHGARDVVDSVLPDEFSSGRWFDGWADYRPEGLPGARGVPVAPGGWKLTVGWRQRYPLLRVAELPTAI